MQNDGENNPKVIPLSKDPDEIPRANRQMFCQLFSKIFRDPKRDIFSGDLMFWHEDCWQPCINYLNLARSAAAEMAARGIAKYSPTLFDPHFAYYQQQFVPQLIAEIPEWDTRDRLHDIANCLQIDGTQEGFSNEVVEDILKAWMAGIFKRLEDPKHQNPMLIFRGPQGCGKDTLITTLIGGLGQFANNLSITGQKDDYLQLNTSLVLNVSEFERSAKLDISTLKDMIFCEHTNLRSPYDRTAKRRTCRHSLISSCNSDDIYRDSTGNRRFWPINLAGILWHYDRTANDSMQILAQAKYLCMQNYQIDPLTLSLIKAYLEHRQPDPIEQELAEHWSDLVKSALQFDLNLSEIVKNRGFLLNKEARDLGIFEKICKAHKITERYLFGKLSAYGLSRRTSGSSGRERGYSIISDS